MASVKELKKDIEYMSSEVITEAMICSLQPNADKAKLDELINKTCDIADDYILRAQHPSGSENKKLTKQYYKTLRENFYSEIDKVYSELTSLNAGRTES